MVAFHYRDSPHSRSARPFRRSSDALCGPQPWHQFLLTSGRRSTPPLAAPFLVLRSPRSLHHDPSRDGSDLGDPFRILPQTGLRLQGDGLRHDRYRLPRLRCLGSPYVREWHESHLERGLLRLDHGDRRPISN